MSTIAYYDLKSRLNQIILFMKTSSNYKPVSANKRGKQFLFKLTQLNNTVNRVVYTHGQTIIPHLVIFVFFMSPLLYTQCCKQSQENM